MRKWIEKNWLILSAGFLLTAVFVRMAFKQRGYIAFGGEWLVFPLLFLTRSLARSAKKELMEWL